MAEVLDRVNIEGPQAIEWRGKSYVVMRQAQLEKLAGKSPTLKDWLLNGPRIDDLELPSRNPKDK